jgi:hypothetical protein
MMYAFIVCEILPIRFLQVHFMTSSLAVCSAIFYIALWRGSSNSQSNLERYLFHAS